MNFNRIKTENVRVIDPMLDRHGHPVSRYWEGKMPVAELLQADPEARCRTTEIPYRKRQVAWWLCPGFVGMLLFATTFLSSGATPDALPLALAFGAFIGGSIGVAIAWLVVRWALKPDPWWHFVRVDTRNAAKYDVMPRAEEDRYVVFGIVPPPVMAHDIDAGEELDKETKSLIWWNEMLALGQEGWASKRYLAAIGASRMREETMKGNGVRPSLVPPAPDQRGNPNG